MSYMSIDLDSLKDIEKRVGSLSKSLEQIKNSLSTVRSNIDSTVRNRSGIDSSMSSLIREVGERERIMNNVKQFLKETIKQYEDMEKELRRESDRIIENSTPKTGIIKSILNGLKSIGKKLGNLLKTIAKNSILLSPIIIGTAVRSIGKMLIERGFIITNKPIEIVKRDDIGLPILNGILSYNPDEYSPYVALLQKRLIELGYGDGLEVTGKFDSKTLDAVNRYKEDYGLWNFGEYEGKVGETTWNHLFKNQKVPYLTIDNVEKDGMGIPVLSGILSYNPWEYSIYVVFLQKRLIELGYGDGLEVNGIFDSKTLEAVNRYKEDYGLWNHDEYEGKVGETTWNHLFKNQKVPFIGGINEHDSNKNQNIDVSETLEFIETAAKIISENESRGYGTVNRKDGTGSPSAPYSLSIGRLQWYGVRAHDLLKKIKDKNPEQAKQILTGTTIYEELMQDRSVFISRPLNEKEAEAVSKLLTTPEGIEVQNETMINDVGDYIRVGKNWGITDARALLYFADLYNQSPKSTKAIVEKVQANGEVTLEALHKAALEDSTMGVYKERRNATYEKALLYDGAKEISLK
ncbi:peptidoglycan-binding domain-containing protein [Acetivibrio saccincola]|uniref:peptidoglycan-binding domain-containing protein n=1 Tax=Acetivibrio saccincola TaxID=1677857 RepID=UPI002C33F186|nr:peptidoglycan-binding protein [Acetivibrio saccincola]HQD29929.1 peptidoglycan-binding protein [Acetivibrio saccincola]